MPADPLLDALRRDVRAYHRLLQQRIVRRMQYDTMRYGAIDAYMDARRRAIHRAAHMSTRALDATREMAAMRARLVLDARYEDTMRDLEELRHDIEHVAEANRQALEALRAMEETLVARRRPGYYDSFDLFREYDDDAL